MVGKATSQKDGAGESAPGGEGFAARRGGAATARAAGGRLAATGGRRGAGAQETFAEIGVWGASAPVGGFLRAAIGDGSAAGTGCAASGCGDSVRLAAIGGILRAW